MYRILTFLFFAFLNIAAVQSQESMSLSDCIAYASTHHTDVRLAQLTVKDADWQIKENRSIAYPQLSAGISYQHFIEQPALPAEALGFGEPGQKLKFALRNNFSGNITYNQLLFNNSYLASIKAAKMYKEYVSIQLASTKEKLRNKVTDAYLPALVVSESMKVLDKNISSQEKLFNETQAVKEAGFVEQLDVDRLEYVLATLRTQRDNLARQHDILLDVLKFTMHKPITDQITLSDNLDALLTMYGNINPDEELNYMNRPDYVAVLKARELSEIQVNAFRRDWFPTLSFFASYNPSFQGNESLFWIPSAIVGFQVNIPIYDGGGSKAKQERAIIQSLQVDEQKNMLVKAFDLEIQTARNQYKSAKQNWTDQQRNLDLAQRIHDSSQTKFKAGVGSSFEVTQAQSGLYQAQSELLRVRYEYLAAIVALKNALGNN